MSTSVTVYGYFGLPVRQEHFLQKIDTIRECPQDHPTDSKAKFCGECGSQLRDVELFTPTDGFVALCMHLDTRTTTKFYELRADHYVKPWHGGWKTGDDRFGLYEADALSQRTPRIFVLGYKIGEYSSTSQELGKLQVPTISINGDEMQLFLADGWLETFAKLLRINEKPRVFACAHWG